MVSHSGNTVIIMAKIKIMTDSPCDIPKQLEQELDIEIISIPITIDDKSYLERVDFTAEEFYKILNASERLPVTAHITNLQYSEYIKRAYESGYEHLIIVCINSKGSNTYNSALMGRDMFFEENPEAKDKFRVHVIDSLTYTMGYGYPVIEAAKKIKKGAPIDEILAYLNDWFACSEIYFAPYSLDFVKKSGRVSVAAAFVGEIIGLRPIISFINGDVSITQKVRGEKSIIPAIADIAVKRIIPHTPYCVVYGEVEEYGKQLADELTKRLGYPPEHLYNAGAIIALNAGTKIAGVIIKGGRK